METLGERIKRLREEQHLTQAELGDLVGVTARSVGNWERNESHPRNRIGALERYFGVSLSDGRPLRDADPVVAAIEAHQVLDRADKSELVSHYWRLLDGHEGRRHA